MEHQLKKNDCLETPRWVWEPLAPFDLDPCAGNVTCIAAENWLVGGLIVDWHGFVFCNPPFSQKELWIEKMIKHGNGILLLPERGSAPWFGPLAMAAGSYWVMGQKINFIGGPSSNNLGTVMFLFGPTARQRIINSGLPGHLVNVERYSPRKCA